MEKKKLRLLGMLIVIGTAILLFALPRVPTAVQVLTQQPVESETPVIVLDAGHGGADGGAVGVSGSLEKELNLSIACRLRDILRLLGCEVVMTREDDNSIHDPDAKTLREQKTSDMKNRLKIIESHPGCVFVSIHQNQFGQPQYHGTQVFYSENHPGSRIVADKIRETVVSLLQPGNEREIKTLGENSYLLSRSKAPAVLVECGFLSNPQEEELLLSEEYQEKLALCIASALIVALPQAGAA